LWPIKFHEFEVAVDVKSFQAYLFEDYDQCFFQATAAAKVANASVEGVHTRQFFPDRNQTRTARRVFFAPFCFKSAMGNYFGW